MKRVLHVGCGRQPMHDIFDDYEEVRCDIDPSCEPDILANLTDLGDIGEFDAIYGAHVLEHFYPHEVVKVMSEFYRVLKNGGFAMMLVPNLEGIAPTREVVYDSPAGPITGLDMYYGKESFVADNPYMAHKTGFVKATLEDAFSGFDFFKISTVSGYNLLGIGVKNAIHVTP